MANIAINNLDDTQNLDNQTVTDVAGGGHSIMNDLADEQVSDSKPFRVPLPGFVSDAEFGLGDAFKLAAASLGFKPCGACARRAAALNSLLVFSGRRGR